MLPQKYICPLVLIFFVLYVQVGDMSEQHVLKATVSRYSVCRWRTAEVWWVICSLFTTFCVGLKCMFCSLRGFGVWNYPCEMRTRINILSNNHQVTLTGISGTLFINIPTCLGQCKATSREIIIKGMTELINAFINFYSI